MSWLLPPQFCQDIEVRDADIDDFGHVNNVVYLGWMARVAWAASKSVGFDFARYESLDCGFVVTRHEIDYRRAAMPGDTVAVATWIARNDGRLRLRRRFQMVAHKTGETLAFGLTDFACMKLSNGRACRMPDVFAKGYAVDAKAEAAFTAALE